MIFKFVVILMFSCLCVLVFFLCLSVELSCLSKNMCAGFVSIQA